MSYIQRNLIPGEHILYRTGLHWIKLLFPVLAGGFFILLGAFLLISGESGAGLFLIGFGALIIMFAAVMRNATEMAVTNKRVIVKVGFLRRKTIELFLPKVESVGVEQGLFGRMLGYGSIVVRGTGGTAEPFNIVDSPLEFRRQVQQRNEDYMPITTA